MRLPGREGFLTCWRLHKHGAAFLSLIVRNAKIFFGGELVEGNILVENGVVKAIGRREFEGDYVLDAEHQPVLPGGIDVHAHVYDPEYADNEDWKTGSLAAAYGGLTTLIDMPLRVYVDGVEVLEAKLKEAAENSYVNYGVTGGFLNKKNIKSIAELRKRGVKTFKIFTCRPFQAEEEALGSILEEIAKTDSVAIVHAEDEGLIRYWEGLYKARNDVVSYHMSRTDSAEAAAILRIGMYARDTGARIHVAHLSSKLGLESVLFLKEKGVKVTSEVCPHHLYFTREDSAKYGNYLKLAPTLKTREDVEALWRGLAEGLIEVYASDNAPAPRRLKEVDVWSAWGGIPNLEIMGPFLYTYGVLKGRISIKRFVEVFSENPAKLLGIYPLMGSISIGSRADLYILETRRAKKISASTHHHKVDWTPWEGIELYGAPLHLVVGGHVIIENGELVGRPGLGVYIGNYVKAL